jgi:hypothetical protein
MGQIFPYSLQDVSQDCRMPSGVRPDVAATFRAVAHRRAPGLAKRYAMIFQAAASAKSGALTWRKPWPQTWRATLTWRQAKGRAVAALEAVHPTLGRKAENLIAMGRVIQSPQTGGVTKPSSFGPPWVKCAFDGSTEAAVTLAHELGHATQMTDASLTQSLSAPPLVLAEIPAHVAERGFHHVFGVYESQAAGLARECDDLLAMMVRHPARDAVEQAGEQAWPDIARHYAPDLTWADSPAPITPRARAEPGSTLAYAIAASFAAIAFDRVWRDSRFSQLYLDWVHDDPMLSLETACGLLGARANDASLYEAAYDLAEASLTRRFDALGASPWSEAPGAPISG